MGCSTATASNDDRAALTADTPPDLAFLYVGEDETRIDAFVSDGTSFAGPTASWQAAEGAVPTNLRLTLRGDFTGDGQGDIAALVAGPQCDLRVLVYAALDGHFAEPDPAGWWSEPFDCARPVRLAAAGDFDGDGVSDIALLRDEAIGAPGIEVLRSDGTRFASTTKLLWQEAADEPASASDLLAADFDGDGWADLALLRTAPDGCRGELHVLISESADFQAADARIWWTADGFCDAPISRVATGDFDADGRADVGLLRQIEAARYVDVLRSDGRRFVAGEAPLWAEEVFYPPDNVRAVTPGDFDHDGRTDLALLSDDGSCAARLRVLLAHDGAFSASEWWASEDYCAWRVVPAAP